VKKEDISEKVAHAIDLTLDKKRELLYKDIPKWLLKFLAKYVSLDTPSIFNKLNDGSITYQSFVLRKRLYMH
jgi:hypothetical protein